MFKAVTRSENRLRLALDGPAGSGKTYTALRFAFAIAARYGLKVAVIDTEHHSASLYAGDAPDGVVWKFDGVDLENFSPSTYTQCIQEAARQGYGVLVIDSLSHAWSGKGGALEQVDRAAGKSGGKFAGWRDVTPQCNTLVDTLIRYPGHVIVTMRTKTEYSIEQDERGKTSVKKLGLKPVQREGVDYEFSVVCDMDEDHRLKVSKTRCSKIDQAIVTKPGPEFLYPVLDWLGEAKPEEQAPARFTNHQPGSSSPDATAAPASAPQNGSTAGAIVAGQIGRLWLSMGKSPPQLQEVLKRAGVARVKDLPATVASELLGRLEKADMERQAKEAF